MQDGNTMRNNYGCDLDSLTMGSRIGMMRTAKGDLHYFINGVDQGVACSGLPPGKGERKQPWGWVGLGTGRASLGREKWEGRRAAGALRGHWPPASSALHEPPCFPPAACCRGLRGGGSVRSVRPGVHHQCHGPHGQQPVHQQHH